MLDRGQDPEFPSVRIYGSWKEGMAVMSDALRIEFMKVTEQQYKQQLKDLQAKIKELEDKGIVRVVFNAGGAPYAYRDPSGSLQVGDLVKVPTYHGTGPEQIATVIGYGKGTYRGEIVSTVISRLAEETL